MKICCYFIDNGASTEVDAMFKKIRLNNITTLNKVMYCGGIIISE